MDTAEQVRLPRRVQVMDGERGDDEVVGPSGSGVFQPLDPQVRGGEPVTRQGEHRPATAVVAAGCHGLWICSAAVAIRNRLYPAAAQVGTLSRHCEDARLVWNLAVEQQSWWWPGRGSAPGGAERQRQLAQARAAEPWLREGSSSVQQQALRDFDRAMTAFFRPQSPAGRPGYRGKRGPQGFVIRDTRVRRVTRRWGEVQVPKCGWVRFRWTRPLPADLGMARVTVDRAGRWHVAFPAPQPALARRAGGGPVGIDRGVRTALVTSGGQHYRAPRISGRQAARYLALEQRLRRQSKGSRRRERTRQAMAQITAGVTDRRRDWAEKVSTRLVKDHDVIVWEKLNAQGMVRRPRARPDPRASGRVPAERGPGQGRAEPRHLGLMLGAARPPGRTQGRRIRCGRHLR